MLQKGFNYLNIFFYAILIIILFFLVMGCCIRVCSKNKRNKILKGIKEKASAADLSFQRCQEP